MNPIRRITYTILHCGGIWAATKLLGYDPWPATTLALAFCLFLAIHDRVELHDDD